jgi:hypothetical protein
MTVVAYIFIDICNLQCRYLQIADIRSADICFIENHPVHVSRICTPEARYGRDWRAEEGGSERPNRVAD